MNSFVEWLALVRPLSVRVFATMLRTQGVPSSLKRPFLDLDLHHEDDWMMNPSWRSVRRLATKRTSRTQFRVHVESLEDRNLMAAGATSYNFDFSKLVSNLAPGTISASKLQYSPELGYGWTTSAETGARSTAGSLKRGLARAARHTLTFQVDLPNGVYEVTPTLAGAGRRTPMTLLAEGQQKIAVSRTAHRSAVSIRAAASKTSSLVTVTDGQLNLQVASSPTTRSKISALKINPALVASAGSDIIAKEGELVSFLGTATGNAQVKSYIWDFGDGTGATGTLTPQHVYLDNNTYNVTLTVTDATGAQSTSTSQVKVSNVAPMVSPGGPYTATAGQSLKLNGSATDPSSVDTAAGFTFIWDFGDGSPQARGLGLSAPAHTYAQPGTYTVSMTAADKDYSVAAIARTTVTVAASAPTLPLTASAGGQYASLEGSSKSLAATASGGSGTYSYAWDLDNNGTYETSGQNVSATFKDNGTYTVGLQVTDSSGQAARTTTTVAVSNAAPTASAGGPYSVTAGQSLAFKGSATDPSTVDTAAGFTYTWNFGDGSAPVSGSGLAAPNYTYAKAGTYTVTVTATDKDNATSSVATATVTVASPTLPLTASAGGQYASQEGSSKSLAATASGGSGTYSYAWDLDNNGTYETSGKDVSTTFEDNGTYTVGLQVTDSSGQTARATTTVTVSNAAPTASVGGPYKATAGKSMSVYGAATDPSSVDTAVGFTYIWDFGDGSPQVRGLGLSAPAHTYNQSGTYTVTVTATDKDNATSSVATTVVTADAPTLPLAVNAGGQYTSQEGSAQSLTALASGGSGTYSYAWDLDNNGTYESVGKDVSTTFKDNGLYTVGVQVTDTSGQTARTTATVAVSNVAPTATTGGPYTATAGQDLAFQGMATDPSVVDTAAGFTYTWNFGDGTSSVSGQNLKNPTHKYASAGVYTAVLTVKDKDGAVSQAATMSVTISSPNPGTGTGLANIVLTTGMATFGQVLPSGVAYGGLQLGNLVTQTDVKTTWPDGSIRYAIVSASVPANGTYTLTAVPKSSGSITPTVPDASVKFTIGGVVYTATLPKTVSNDLWLDGPVVKEWRSVVAPVDPSGTPHPFLRVYFDTRSYSNGKSRVDVTVENNLDVAGATNLSYDVSISAGGQTLFSRTGVTQYYLTRWRQVFDLGLTESQVTHDFEPFYQANALPRYLDTITNQTYSTTGSTFDILGRGANMYDGMGTAGGRPEIAPYPDWAARYLVYQTPDQQDYLLANGDLAGSWPVHIRESDGGLVNIDERPQFWLDPRGQGPWSGVPLNDQPKGDLSWANRGPLVPDTAHVPSLAYIPYLVTGDRYYADEMGFWGNDAMIASWPASIAEGGRGGAQGIVGPEQVRARAWGLRNLTDAASYLPDSDPDKAYLSSKVTSNLNFYDNYAATHDSPLGTVLEMVSGNPTTDLVVSVWQNNYLAWAIDHAADQGFTGGTAMRDRIVNFQLQLFTMGSEWPREYAAPYYPVIGRIQADGTRVLFTTMAEVFNATYRNSDGSIAPPQPLYGYYGVDARLSLMTAMNEGWAGAQDSYDWLFPQILTDLNNRAGWAIAQKKRN